MSSPLIWIVLPILLSGLMLPLLNRPAFLKWFGTGAALIFAVSAWLLPIDAEARILFWDLSVSDQLMVFGRSFILSRSDLDIVGLLFLMCFFWFFIMDPGWVPIQLVPLGLTGAGLIISGFAVEPIFYGALFFAFLALIFVVLFSPPGEQPTPGVFRYLIYQTLGIIFVLFASWLGSWVDFDAGDQTLYYRAALMLALGFSFLLAIFPFSSWVLMVAEKNHPFLAAFVFNVSFFGVFLFGLRFIVEPGWLQGYLTIPEPLQFAGILMVGVGGITAVFSNHLGRIMAAAVIIDIGRSLAAVSLVRDGFPLYFSFLMIQMLSLGTWGLSLSLLRQVVPDLGFSSITGAGRQWPTVALGILIGHFSLAGLPFLGGFPYYWSLGTLLDTQPFWISGWLYLGSFGLIISGIRVFSQLAKKSGEEMVFIVGKPFLHWVTLGISLLLVGIGLFPRVVISWMGLLAAALY